jgi:hypothetical protein
LAFCVRSLRKSGGYSCRTSPLLSFDTENSHFFVHRIAWYRLFPLFTHHCGPRVASIRPTYIWSRSHVWKGHLHYLRRIA